MISLTSSIAITGTENEVVLKNYTDYIELGLNAIDQVASASLISLIAKNSSTVAQYRVTRSNMALMKLGFGSIEPVIVYNNLAWQRREIVHISTNRKDCIILDNNGKVVESQVDTGKNSFEIYFEAVIPPLGHQTYFVKVTGQSAKRTDWNGLTFSNAVYDVLFDDSKRILKIVNKKSGVQMNIRQEVRYII